MQASEVAEVVFLVAWLWHSTATRLLPAFRKCIAPKLLRRYWRPSTPIVRQNLLSAISLFVLAALRGNFFNKKHLKNVGPIRHCEPLHAACSNFTLPFTRCRYCRTSPALKSMSTTTTTMRDRGDRYGPIEWAQLEKELDPTCIITWRWLMHAQQLVGSRLRDVEMSCMKCTHCRLATDRMQLV